MNRMYSDFFLIKQSGSKGCSAIIHFFLLFQLNHFRTNLHQPAEKRNAITIAKDIVKAFVRTINKNRKNFFLRNIQLFQKHPGGKTVRYFDWHRLPKTRTWNIVLRPLNTLTSIFKNLNPPSLKYRAHPKTFTLKPLNYIMNILQDNLDSTVGGKWANHKSKPLTCFQYATYIPKQQIKDCFLLFL